MGVGFTAQGGAELSRDVNAFIPTSTQGFVAWLGLFCFVGAGCPAAPAPGPTATPDAGVLPERTPSPAESDPDPLTRLTPQQYYYTVSDLFAPIWIEPLKFPRPIEGPGGFENNASFATATPVLVESYQTAARDLGGLVAEPIIATLPCDEDASCAQESLRDIARRAWRRPLTPDEVTGLNQAAAAWTEEFGLYAAFELAIQYILQSPEFVYQVQVGESPGSPDAKQVALTPHEVASRLSYLLWGTMPDATLSQAADNGELRDAASVRTHAERMLQHPRARVGVVDFHRQLFDFDEVGSQGIDLEFYRPVIEANLMLEEPGEDLSDLYFLEYIPELRYEGDVFVAQHIFEGAGTLAALLTSNQSWTTFNVGALAYGVEPNEDSEPVEWPPLLNGVQPPEEFEDFGEGLGTIEFWPVELDATKRAGVFSLASFLSTKTSPRHPSPVKRGVHVLERLLCVHLEPPGDVPPLEESTAGAEPKTNREKYAMHLQSEACAGCHRIIDGIGMTFENYDALGRWRDTDNGYPVDATGELVSTDQDGPVDNWVGMANRLAKSRKVHDCYTTQWFRYAFGRGESSADVSTLDDLKQKFWSSGGDVQQLLVDIATSHAFRHRSAAR